MTAEVVTQAAALAFSVWVLLCAVATMAAGRVITRHEALFFVAPAYVVAGLVWVALKGSAS